MGNPDVERSEKIVLMSRFTGTTDMLQSRLSSRSRHVQRAKRKFFTSYSLQIRKKHKSKALSKKISRNSLTNFNTMVQMAHIIASSSRPWARMQT